MACLDAAGRRIEPAAPNAIKFERFIFDLMPEAQRAIVVEVDLAEAFAPLKNASGAKADTPETVREQLLALHRGWLRQAARGPRCRGGCGNQPALGPRRPTGGGKVAPGQGPVVGRPRAVAIGVAGGFEPLGTKKGTSLILANWRSVMSDAPFSGLIPKASFQADSFSLAGDAEY